MIGCHSGWMGKGRPSCAHQCEREDGSFHAGHSGSPACCFTGYRKWGLCARSTKCQIISFFRHLDHCRERHGGCGPLSNRAQLSAQSEQAMVLLCFDGLMRVKVGKDRWFIPDRFGIWIPAETVPRVETSGGIEFQAFQLHPRFGGRILACLASQPFASYAIDPQHCASAHAIRPFANGAAAAVRMGRAGGAGGGQRQHGSCAGSGLFQPISLWRG